MLKDTSSKMSNIIRSTFSFLIVIKIKSNCLYATAILESEGGLANHPEIIFSDSSRKIRKFWANIHENF